MQCLSLTEYNSVQFISVILYPSKKVNSMLQGLSLFKSLQTVMIDNHCFEQERSPVVAYDAADQKKPLTED